MVSSASEGDGKTSTAINLAIAYSYLGKKVVLIDADIRRHRLSQALELNHEPGLTELLSGEMTLEDVIQHWKGNIFAISSGKFIENSMELLNSVNLTKPIQGLDEVADLIVIDGPPFFLSETSSLSAIVNGVLLVIPIGSSKDKIKQMKTQLDMIRAPVIGIIANKVGKSNYYGYYYSNYQTTNETQSPQNKEIKTAKPVTIFTRIKNLFPSRDGKEKRKTHSTVKEKEAIRIPTEIRTRNDQEEVSMKTVPRITNPKTILERAVLKSSMKTVEEDKEHLQDLARKKREQDSNT